MAFNVSEQWKIFDDPHVLEQNRGERGENTSSPNVLPKTHGKI
jgi:hypothetical protein